MKLIIKLFGILILILGISLLIKPEIILSWIEGNIESSSLYITTIVLRIIFGILFILIAKESKYPDVIKILGYLFIISGIILIFIGHEIFQDFINSLISDAKPFAPVSGLFGIAFGGFLIYAFSKIKKFELK